MVKVGDELVNGAVVVAEVDSNGLITKITIPLLGSPGFPFTITFSPGKTVEEIEALVW